MSQKIANNQHFAHKQQFLSCFSHQTDFQFPHFLTNIQPIWAVCKFYPKYCTVGLGDHTLQWVWSSAVMWDEKLDECLSSSSPERSLTGTFRMSIPELVR